MIFVLEIASRCKTFEVLKTSKVCELGIVNHSSRLFSANQWIYSLGCVEKKICCNRFIDLQCSASLRNILILKWKTGGQNIIAMDEVQGLKRKISHHYLRQGFAITEISSFFKQRNYI